MFLGLSAVGLPARFALEVGGGTHLDNTAKVGVFHIDSEFSVASGVRRIEATKIGRASCRERVFRAV